MPFMSKYKLSNSIPLGLGLDASIGNGTPSSPTAGSSSITSAMQSG